MTFTCYGVRLHGSAAGSVDRYHNAARGRYVEENPALEDAERRRMSCEPVSLTATERAAVLPEIVASCVRQGWLLQAAHVRSTHVHAVVTAEVEPEVVLGKLKAFCSRALNERFGRKEKRWTRHGSAAWLWEPHRLEAAVDYVVRRQGRPMELYVNQNAWLEYWEIET